MFVSHLAFIVLIALSSASDGNVLADKIEHQLMEGGFENVSLTLEDGRLIVTYENRIYRHEMQAIKRIVIALLPLIKEGMNVILVPQSRGIPLFAINIPVDRCISLLSEESISDNDVSDDLNSVWKVIQSPLRRGPPGGEYGPDIEVTFDVEPTWRRIMGLQKTDSLFCRCGIIVHPQFRALYGDHSDPLQSQVDLAPEFNAGLWKGMLLSAQLAIQIQNDLSEDSGYWRPGLVTLNQAIRLPYNTFVSATVGYFTEQRYGADLEIRKFFANGRWNAGANVGYTGHASYIENVWYYSHIGLLTAFLDLEYRFSRLDLRLRTTYGEFLFGDRGWRFDISRQCKEVDIGFFTLKSSIGWNAGFNLSVPIYPSKRLAIGDFRVGPAEKFRQEYRSKGLLNAGIRYRTGNSVDGFMKELNPGYIKNQIAGLRDW